MREATFTELRNQAKTFFDVVEGGETVRIYRNGKPIADIVPVNRHVPAWKRSVELPISLDGISLADEVIKDRIE
jgi:antitoxin (DNA-binding transcriptional repressor) of toxin-antitoxin stability system